METQDSAVSTKQRLVEAGIKLILKQGYSSTSVEDICAEAQSTKGGFFHHFKNKEAFGIAAVEAWGKFGASLYEPAWNAEGKSALDKLKTMLEIMAGFTERPDQPCTCIVGMMAQETSQTHPLIKDACTSELNSWTEHVAEILADLKKELKKRQTPMKMEAIADDL